jgi:hypothetical protein
LKKEPLVEQKYFGKMEIKNDVIFFEDYDE